MLFYQDENRYSAGRGAHLTLKRAEKARLLVNKIPGIYLCNMHVICDIQFIHIDLPF